MIYYISFENLTDRKPPRIRFDKKYDFIRNFDGTRYLKLFVSEKYGAIYDRIRYLKNSKKNVTYIFSHSFARIAVKSYDSSPTEERLTLHNAIIQKNFRIN